ncbi:AMP-binding protein [Desarmillaria ectypa]|nr:AMP-binding protein [Desarmillaria ectypa]
MESLKIFTAGPQFLHHIFLAVLRRYFVVATQPIHSTKDLKEEVSEKICGSIIPDHSFGPRVDATFNCVHHAFEPAALSNGDQVVVVDHLGNSMSYSQLNRLSLRLVTYLTSCGVRPGSFVGLVVQRSIPQVIAILGVLRAGAAYIPLDGDVIRDDTLQGIVTDANPSYVLVSKGCISRADLLSHPYGCLEDVLDSIKDSDTGFVQDQSKGSGTAYIIFTSGMKVLPANPKVSWSANVVNLLSMAPGNLHIEPGVKVAQLLNIGFDMCAWETLGCLMNGGTLYLRGPRRADWLKVLKTVDVVIAAPSILLPHDPKDFPNVRVVATAGEPCPQSLADKWASQATFYNSCGPTEITIVNTMHKHIPNTPLSIGKPTENNTVYILDEYLRPVSKGYLELDELTAKRFLPDPYLQDGSRMYNTGDIGKWRADGSLDHLGRVDDQVKIKGFRVELDGVSAAMQSCPEVTGACALLVEGELVGFYTPSEVAMVGVRDVVSRILPWYSVPTKFISIPSLPLTKNGKTDKGELRSIAIQQILG